MSNKYMSIKAIVILSASTIGFAQAEEISPEALHQTMAGLQKVRSVERDPLVTPSACAGQNTTRKSLADKIASAMKISVKITPSYDSNAEQFFNGSAEAKLLLGNKDFEAALGEIGAGAYRGPRYIVNGEVSYSPAGDAAISSTREDSISELAANINSARQSVRGSIIQQIDAAMGQDPRTAQMPPEMREQIRSEMIEQAMTTANAAIDEEYAAQVARIKNRTSRLVKNNRIPETSVTLAYVLGNGAGIIYSKAGVSTPDSGPSRSAGQTRLEEKLPFRTAIQLASTGDPSRLAKVGTALKVPGKASLTLEAVGFHDRPAADGVRGTNSIGLAVDETQFKNLYESEKMDSVKGTVRFKKAGAGEFYVAGGVKGKENYREVQAGAVWDVTRKTSVLVDAHKGSGPFLKKGASIYVSQGLPLKLEAVAGATYVKDSFRADMAAGRNDGDNHVSYTKYSAGLNLNLPGRTEKTFRWNLRLKAHGYYLDPIDNVNSRSKGKGLQTGAFIEGTWGMPQKTPRAIASEKPAK